MGAGPACTRSRRELRVLPFPRQDAFSIPGQRTGVALAAIQGLHAENQALKAENVALEARVTALEQTVAALEEAVGYPGRRGGGQ